MPKIMDPHSANTPALNLPEPPVGGGTAINDPSHAAALNPQAAIDAVPADDGSNELDQEWINKAKVIVENTKSDPFSESRELGKMKADYLKIRYNKHIKVTEDHA